MIDCAGKEGVSSDDLKNLLAKKPPTTYAGKCVGACVGEIVGMVSYHSWNHSIFHFNFKFFWRFERSKGIE